MASSIKRDGLTEEDSGDSCAKEAQKGLQIQKGFQLTFHSFDHVFPAVLRMEVGISRLRFFRERVLWPAAPSGSSFEKGVYDFLLELAESPRWPGVGAREAREVLGQEGLPRGDEGLEEPRIGCFWMAFRCF